ncbi:hypothetical protein [Saccharothrix deserti]|uniref:hypothetical protein n=1 Tax=Saccharothrix deserti TaxID=2593674 RepID=UPI00131B56CD|nr:hypothetical protein [Saccharothrix deserti]
MPSPPAHPTRLRLEHVTGFEAELRSRHATEQVVWMILRKINSVLLVSPMAESLVVEVLDHLRARRRGLDGPATRSSYSDGELQRLIRRLRQEAAAIRDRVQSGQQLAERYRDAPDEMEVRRTRQMGGHLPSAARSNTYPVLFSNYLSWDATVRDWAQEVVATALTDAEDAAWQAHRQALARAGGHLRVIGGDPTPQRLEQEGVDSDAAERVAAGEQDAAWTTCADPDQHPETGRPCRTPSRLDCFHCGNCVITRDWTC